MKLMIPEEREEDEAIDDQKRPKEKHESEALKSTSSSLAEPPGRHTIMMKATKLVAMLGTK